MDMFDQIASQGQATAAPSQATGDIFDQLAPKAQPQQAPAPSRQGNSVANIAESAAGAYINPLARFAARGIVGANNALASAGVGTAYSPQQVNQLFNPATNPNYNPVFPQANQSNWTGQLGGAVGGMAQMAIGGPVLAGVAGAEHGIENVEAHDINAAKTGGQQLGAGDIFTQVAGQGGLNALLAGVGPGGKATTALLGTGKKAGIIPALSNVIADKVKNVVVNAIAGSAENTANQIGSNLINKATTNPNQDVTEGAKEAALIGGAGGTIVGGAHEAIKSAVGAPSSYRPPKLTEDRVASLEQAVQGLKEYPQKAQEPAQEYPQLTTDEKLTPAEDRRLSKVPFLVGDQEPAQVAPGSTEATQGATTVPPTESEPAKGPSDLPPSVKNYQAKVRIPGTAENKAVPMTFEDPMDQAAYLAGNQRGGKVATDALNHLRGQGLDDDEIQGSIKRVQQRALDAAKRGNTTLAPELNVSVVDEKDYTPEHQQIADISEKLNGKAPILYNDPGPNAMAGLATQDTGDNYINVAKLGNPKEALNTVAHEAMHGWQTAYPDLADRLWEATPQDISDADAAEYLKNMRAIDPDFDFNDADHRQREAQAMGAGRMFSDPKVRDAVMAKEPGLVQKFVDWVTSKFTGKTGEPMDPLVQKYIDTAREAIARNGEQAFGASTGEVYAKPGAKATRGLEEDLTPEEVRQKALLEPLRGQFDPNTKKTYWWEAADKTHDDVRKAKGILDSDVTPDMAIKVGTDKRGRLVYDSDYGTHDPNDTENPFHEVIKGAKQQVLAKPAAVPTEEDEQRPTGIPAREAAAGEPAPSPVQAKPAVLQKFEDEDIKPRWQAATTGVADSFKTLRNFLGLQGMGTSGQEGATIAKNLFRYRGAELANRYDRMHAALGETRDIMNKTMDVPAQRAFVDNLEAGKPQATPELDRVATAMRDILDDRAGELAKRGYLGNYIQNYFPHIWSDYNKAESFYARTPLEGDKGFLKARSLPTQADGIAAGLTPLFENPIDAVMHRVHSMDKFLTANDTFNSLAKDGLLKQMQAHDPVAEGYQKIDDKISRVYAPASRKGAVQEWKRFDAPEAVASVINNYTDPGFVGKPGAFPLRVAMGIGNTMNMVQLGLSGFHASMTAGNSIISSVANGIRDARAGEIGSGVKSIALAPVAPIRDYLTGGKIQQEWANPGSTDAQTAQLVQILKQAGGRANKDLKYDNGFVRSFKTALDTGNYIGAGMRAPAAILEYAARPIMEKLVPRLKLGAFAEDVQRSMRDTPDLSANGMMTAAGKSWDSIDNRFGQLVYDNVFWNKSLKQALQLGTRSVGWNLGTVRELGGGIADIARGSGITSPLSSRAAYTLALPMVTAVAGSLISKLVYNQDPQDAKDMFYPRTGEKDKQGRDVRIALPTYMKDVYSYSTHPVDTLAHKASPLINSMLEVMKNEDFYGHQIVDPKAGLLDELAQAGKYTGGQFVPFSLRSGQQTPSWGRRAGQFAGFVEASADVKRSDAEAESQTRTKQWSTGPITEDEANKFKARSDLREAMNKAPADQRRAMAITAMHQGIISQRQVPDMMEQSALPSLLARQVAHFTKQGEAGLENAMAVYAKGTPEEQATLKPIILGHLNKVNQSEMTDAQRASIRAIRAKLSGATNGPQ